MTESEAVKRFESFGLEVEEFLPSFRLNGWILIDPLRPLANFGKPGCTTFTYVWREGHEWVWEWKNVVPGPGPRRRFPSLSEMVGFVVAEYQSLRKTEDAEQGGQLMTEAEWLVADDPSAMLRFLGPRLSDRKRRLFACACCRLFWHLLSGPLAAPAVDAAERYADGLISHRQLQDIACGRWSQIEPVSGVAFEKVLQAVQAAAAVSRGTVFSLTESFQLIQRVDEDRKTQAILLRDLAGNPYRTLSGELPWLTWESGMVAKLAQSIYDERSFEDLPVLADALEDAGCRDAVLLEHCRARGPHAKGCWAVDLLLQKK
jgi:hypothetical protein